MNKMAPSERKSKINKSIGPGLAGASGGTLMLMIAGALPEKTIYKSILTYLAPSISIFLSFLGIWIKKEFADYNRNKKINLVLKQLEIFMNDPATSAAHKESLRQKREQIQMAIVSSRMNEVEKLYDGELAI